MEIILLLIFILLIIFYSKIENFKVFNTITWNTPKSNINLDNFYRISLRSDKKENSKISIYENRFKLLPVMINNTNLSTDNSLYTNNYDYIKSNNCCLVSKELENNNSFSYNYKILKDDECNINNFELDQNNQLFFDGINGWNNKNMCKKNNTLGSCKHHNFECIDFIDKDTCNSYNDKIILNPQNRSIYYKWDSKPCYSK